MPDNDAVDFRDLLQKPLGDFPDRPNLPGAKTFYGKLISLTAGVEKTGTPYFRFDGRLTDGGQDVKKTDLDALAAAGFSLADYEVYGKFWLTLNAMPMLRRFLESLGFNGSQSFAEALKLNEQGEPTVESQEVVRGLDFIGRTQPADAQGRVFSSLDMMMGTKGPAGKKS